MALKECEKCGALIVDTTPACPKCDHKRTRNKKKWELLWTILVFTSAVVWLWFFQLHDKQQVVRETLQQFVGQSVIIHEEQDVQVLEGHYRYYQVILKGSAELTIDYEIKSGSNLDVFFFNTKNFNLWKKKNILFPVEEYDYLTEMSSFGVARSSKTHLVEAGTYYVVFDNTEWGPTKPPADFHNDITTLDLRISRQNYK